MESDFKNILFRVRNQSQKWEAVQIKISESFSLWLEKGIMDRRIRTKTY